MNFFFQKLFPLLPNTKDKCVIACDKIVTATHLQIQITLQTKMFIGSNEHVLCWGQTLLALQTNAFRTGDEQCSTGHERIENECSHFTHTHAHTYTHTHTLQVATSDFQAKFMSR